MPIFVHTFNEANLEWMGSYEFTTYKDAEVKWLEINTEDSDIYAILSIFSPIELDL